VEFEAELYKLLSGKLASQLTRLGLRDVGFGNVFRLSSGSHWHKLSVSSKLWPRTVLKLDSDPLESLILTCEVVFGSTTFGMLSIDESGERLKTSDVNEEINEK
jgi:hypothetical protein